MKTKKSIILLLLTCVGIFVFIQGFKNGKGYDNLLSGKSYRSTQKFCSSPYAVFGDSSVTLMTEQERTQNHLLEIGGASKLTLDMKTGVVKTYNETGELVRTLLLDADEIARFMTQDRFAEKYHSMSPYQYAANNPIKNIDVNGDSIKISIYENDVITNLIYVNGKLYNNNEEYKGNNEFAIATFTALNKIADGDVGNDLVTFLSNNKENIVTINQGYRIGDNRASSDGKGLLWNPNQADDGYGNARPNYTALAHEMAHIEDKWKNTFDGSEWYSITDNGKVFTRTKSEIYATHIENQIRIENNIPFRMFDTPGLDNSRIISDEVVKKGIVIQRGGFSVYYNGFDYKNAHARRQFIKTL